MAIFDVDTNDIKNLDEVGLPTLIYQIMYYEVAKLNLLNQGLQISLNTKVGDGGSDGEFNFFDKSIPKNHQYLPSANIVFQFKATEISDKAWFEKEILSSDKSDLKPKLKDLIIKEYTYLLITNKTDLPTQNIEVKETILRQTFSDAGYPHVNVKIITLPQLATWASSIPQIYLSRNPSARYFDLFDSYECEIKQYSESIEYINDKKREDGIRQIRDEIVNTLSVGGSSFIRIEGFSGIGKTRFVYEALNDEKFKQFVLYVRSYKDVILDALVSFCKKLPANSKELVIFVIDECPYDNHVDIYRNLNQYPNLVIITIDQVLSQQDKINCKDEKRIILEGLSEDETVKLIQKVNPVLKGDLAKKIAYFTEGYPRLAKFMAESYDIEKGDTNNPNFQSELLDQILLKITDKVEDIKILQAISMFKMFPNSEEFQQYKRIIFEHFGIESVSALITIKNLIKKGIVREAGRFLYISPRPISIYLFNQFLENNDYDFIDGLFDKLNNSGLANSFFEKLQGIKFDTSQHKDLLFQILSKLTYEQISDGFGSKVFYTLCLKDRKYAIQILKNLLTYKTKEDLLKLEDGRRYLVHALEELIAFKDTFIDSAKILFQLARAENESWGNNSKGVFKATFQLILGGTEVNIVKRLELLKSLYQDYTTDEDRLILLEAVHKSFPKRDYTATHKNHSNFPEHIPDHYYPETQDEVDAYFEKLKELIAFVYNESSEKLQLKILNDLIHSSRIMMKYSQINIWFLDFIEESLIEHPQFKTSVFEEISTIIKYDQNDNLPEDIVHRLESLYNKFTKTESIEDIKELFFKTEKYRYNSEEVFESHCQVIAQNILIHKNLDGLIDKSTSNLFELGRELAKIDDEHNLYEEVLNLLPALTKDSNDRFVLAYIFASKGIDLDSYPSLFHEIYSRLNDKSLMFNFIHSSKITKTTLEYLYMLLEKHEINSSLLENLTFGFWLRDFDKNEFINFMDKINSIIENKCDSFDLCIQYIHEKKDKELVEKYTVYYLMNNILLCNHNNRSIHYIDEMIDDYFLCNLELTDELLLNIWTAVLEEFENEGKFGDRNFHSIYKIIQKYPDFFWEKIKNKLDVVKPKKYPLYGRFNTFLQGGYMGNTFNQSLFNYIDSEQVLKWLKITNYEEARYIIANSLNIDFNSNSLPDIVIKLLILFPDDEDLYASLTCSNESWMGSYVPIANEKISNIDSMLELYRGQDSVVEFLKRVKERFEYRRDREQVRDEERLF